MADWQVSLLVSGPVTVNRTTTFRAEKGAIDSFWTDVSVFKTSHGVRIDIVAKADNQSDANDAALYFVGQALDYLCLKINLPLYVSLSGTQIRPVDDNVRRIVRIYEWEECFREGREIGVNRLAYSRALSWYRKGKNSEDPVDAFLSFWSAIEGIGSKFARDTDRTRQGTINKICDCFDQLWLNVSNWKVIANDAPALNALQQKRNGIAHGFLRIDVDTLKSISSDIPTISALAYEFLKDWEHRGINPEPNQNV